MMHTAPRVSDGLVSGTGLDNAIGVLLLLLSAHFLSQYAPDAFAGRRVIFAFTDQEGRSADRTIRPRRSPPGACPATTAHRLHQC